MSSLPHYNKFSSGDPKSGWGFFEFIALEMRQVSLPFNAFFFFLKYKHVILTKVFA